MARRRIRRARDGRSSPSACTASSRIWPSSRRNEIGIRLSLGSTRAQIAKLVLRDNVWLLAAGLAIGLPLTVAAMRGASTLLFGLTPTDVPTVVGATVLLALAAVLAGAIPAWRAARIRPDVALRSE